MNRHRLRPPLLLPLLLTAPLAGCGTDLLANEGFEISCDGQPCDWKLLEGEGILDASWHGGDSGADLSGSGRAVIEQRSAPLSIPGRELLLRAAVAREGASIRFELDWYVEGQGEGATYWDREPLLVDSRGFEVEGEGVLAVEELVSTPSPEVSGLVLRVVKEGSGLAIIDEVSLTEPAEVAP